MKIKRLFTSSTFFGEIEIHLSRLRTRNGTVSSKCISRYYDENDSRECDITPLADPDMYHLWIFMHTQLDKESTEINHETDSTA